MDDAKNRLNLLLTSTPLEKLITSQQRAADQLKAMSSLAEQFKTPTELQRMFQQTASARRMLVDVAFPYLNANKLQNVAALVSPPAARLMQLDWYRSMLDMPGRVSKILGTENADNPMNRWLAISEAMASSGVLKRSQWPELQESISSAAGQIQDDSFRGAVQEANAEASHAVAQANGTVEFGLRSFSELLFQKVDPLQALSILLMIALFMITPYWDFYVKDKLSKVSANEDRQALAKDIAREIKKLEFPPAYAAMRRITTEDLTVHLNGKVLSPVVGQLPAGAVVEFVQSADAWTQVVWRDSEGLEMAGWVLTRYLMKLK
ncbi:SH3 domain-containing protein [Variovorax boronicumulans]|uniref:SH3 domain-containing protein n=1 Tax=Variovorax boronicumulans TaxID=436515 RepID=UPI000784A846|nr:SH3 domain-containing protein [Variovorax boronicumulans]